MSFIWNIEIPKVPEKHMSKNGHEAGSLSDILSDMWKMRVNAFRADV